MRTQHLRTAIAAAAVCAAALACARDKRDTGSANDAKTMAALPWDSVVAQARGTKVLWRMWRGDPAINTYIDTWVAPALKQRFDIALQAVDGQGAELVNTLVTEREAGRGHGTASLLWINGETFSQLRREQLLGGPWSQVLPNAQYVDSSSTIIARDFEQNPEGFESPWGTVQFALIFDSLRTPHPPLTVNELGDWIRQHPGRFTHDQSFGGVTFLKMLMYARAGGVAQFQNAFDSTRYRTGRDSVFAFLRSVTPFFWRKGATYPPDVAALHRLFANNEIDFTMTNNLNEVASKIRLGVLPPTARVLLLHDGTIANAHFVGIPFNAPNAAGAMVVANFLLSPEAQLEKAKPDVWADGSVLERSRLPDEWTLRFAQLEQTARALPVDSMRKYARPEVSPLYHERLQADWRSAFRHASP